MKKLFQNLFFFLIQDDSLWACLAGMAAAHKELSTAEIAYAAIDEVSVHGT